MSIKYELNSSIKLMNGNEINELALDYDKLSCGDLKTANRIAKMIAESSTNDVDTSKLSPRLDPNLRIGIAWVAAIKGTPGLTVNDVLQLGMLDALCLSEQVLSDYLFR